jgi:hypothetical protein
MKKANRVNSLPYKEFPGSGLGTLFLLLCSEEKIMPGIAGNRKAHDAS